jgi:hypothetical protein
VALINQRKGRGYLIFEYRFRSFPFKENGTA